VLLFSTKYSIKGVSFDAFANLWKIIIPPIGMGLRSSAGQLENCRSQQITSYHRRIIIERWK